MHIPLRQSIIARIADLRADAAHQTDAATVRQLTNLTRALEAGMLVTWSDDGDLLIASASVPGLIYTVSCGRCDCPSWKPCKHVALFDILIAMRDTAAGDADFEADCDEPAPQPWIIGALFRRVLACDPPIDIPDEPYPPTPGGPEPPDWRTTVRAYDVRLSAARSAGYALAWAA